MAVTTFPRLTLLVATLASSAALADQYHYKDNLPGERAAGLGGAYIAVSDDPSGIFYNPAGIMFSNDNYFSLSANAYNSAKTVYKNVWDGGKDYTYTSSNLVPTFLGFTQSYQKVKWGFAVATIRSDLYDMFDEFNVRLEDNRDYAFRRRYFQQDTLTVAGPAAAYEVAPNVVLGVSLLGFNRTVKRIDSQHIKLVSDVQDLSDPCAQDPSSGSCDPDKSYSELKNGKTQDAFVSSTTQGLWPKFGIQIMPFPKFSFGATISKPITIHSNRKWFEIVESEGSLRNDDPNAEDANGDPMPLSLDVFNDSPSSATADLYSPVFVGLGAAWFPSQRFLLTADFEYATGDTGYKDFKVVPTYNWSIGTEYFVINNLALRFGLHSNNAITQEVKSGKTNQPEHVDLLGLTLGISHYRPGSSLTLGASYTTGSGKGQAFQDDPRTHDVQQNVLSIYLTGSYQL